MRQAFVYGHTIYDKINNTAVNILMEMDDDFA